MFQDPLSGKPNDGGYLRTPDGVRIPLRLENDLWHLPVFATPTSTARVCTLRKDPPMPESVNTFDILAEDDSEPTCYPVAPPAPTPWTQADIQTAHEAWCHPGTSKTDAIINCYPDLYPKDPRYRAAVRKHRCPVCDLMKGARTYRKSKRMKTKKGKKTTPEGALLSSIASCEPASVCSHHGSGWRRLHVGVVLPPQIEP
mmetsp:Transcript_18485/g.37521  ORF Transcript_18485/g.37521 Transcript_18485/m.37521 type:complete len:200 (+) Transcript_18485:493-1092(+)